MADIINVQDLTAEDVRFVQQLVDLLRERAKRKELPGDQVSFNAWPLGVKGPMNRREIYDHL